MQHVCASLAAVVGVMRRCENMFARAVPGRLASQAELRVWHAPAALAIRFADNTVSIVPG